jgi:protein AbiQ
MKFYHIKDTYINFLRKYDEKVPENKNESRPYVGIVLTIGDIEYYAPFSSPKPKHKKMRNTKDFRKIGGGLYGAINFNNMIPVVKSALIYINIKSIDDVKYRSLLLNQYRSIVSDADKIKENASELYSLIQKDDAELSVYEQKIKSRCCNLSVLEKVFRQYTE